MVQNGVAIGTSWSEPANSVGSHARMMKTGFKMTLEFTAHNIRLDDGTFTKPDSTVSMVEYPWFISARGVLETVFPGDKSKLRLADVGCLEGGYASSSLAWGSRSLGLKCVSRI